MPTKTMSKAAGSAKTASAPAKMTKSSKAAPMKIDFAGFVLDETTGKALRYAQILLFAKQHYPGVFIPKNVLYKVANRCAKAPSMDSSVLKGLSAILARTKKLLTEDAYGELLMQEKGCYRLAADYEERLTKVLPKAAEDYARQTERFARIVDLQDASRVPNRPELEEHKRQLEKMQTLTHRLRSSAFQSALAVPALPAHEE
jgi:hypothetical protein